MNEEQKITAEELKKTRVGFDGTTYEITPDPKNDPENNGYAPGRMNNGKGIVFVKPKTKVRTIFNQNIGLGNKGFTKMLGLGLLLAIFAIIIIFILNRI